jgi:hypothetical protein
MPAAADGSLFGFSSHHVSRAMRNLASLFSFLLLLCAWDGGAALAPAPSPVHSPDGSVLSGTGRLHSA